MSTKDEDADFLEKVEADLNAALKADFNAAVNYRAPGKFLEMLRILVGGIVRTDGALWIEADDGELRITTVMSGATLHYRLAQDGTLYKIPPEEHPKPKRPPRRNGDRQK